jgi:Glycosyltransferase family 87
MATITLDRRTLLYLYIGLRLVLLIAHQPLFVQVAGNSAPLERGLTVYGDFAYHLGIAENSRFGLLPYRDFWYEYPPLIPAISKAAQLFSGGNFTAYANLLALINLVCDGGTLLLCWAIGARLYGENNGALIAVCFALMPAPLIVGFWNFEGVVTVAVMAALWALIEGRYRLAGLLIGLGALVKLVPILLLGAAVRFVNRSQALIICLVAGGITVVGLGWVAAQPYGLLSLTAQWNKPSAQTVWALLDGNYITGAFSNDRTNPAALIDPRGKPAVVPALLKLALFAGVGAAAFLTSQRRDALGLIAFTGFTIALFYLWSSTWSTQWLALLVPLILLSLPGRAGVLITLALAVVSFIEYPLLFARGADAAGILAAAFVPLLNLTVLARTAILIGLALWWWNTLRQATAKGRP